MTIATKEHVLNLLEVKVQPSLLHFNINIFNAKNPAAAEVSIFTNSKGKLVTRFNPWDEVDGVKVIK